MVEWLEAFFETRAGTAVGAVLFAAAVVLVTWMLAGVVSRVMRRLMERQKRRGSGAAAVLGFARYAAVAAVYFAGFMVVVSGIPLLSSAVKTLLTAGGVIAVVAGLAAQEALGSVVSGMMILAFKPFKLGDVVRYIDNDISGVIEEITLHHTTIRTWENKHVIIPNSKMNSAIIENADYADSKVCVFLEVGVSYESDLDLAKQLLADEVARQADYLDVRTPAQKAAGAPPVQVVVLALAESSVTLRAALWARDNGTAFALKCAVLENVKKAFAQNGIDIAYPHVVVVQK
ncbi:MAG: mechanosensitive ion channel family protein [Eubacteriales bacterium]|nr:mechanosensitive ion channel family protein [Eubacteriales bacterium]